MLKEKILTALKERFKGLGIQDSLLDRFATTLSVTVKEENAIDTAVQAIQLSQLVQSEFDSKVTASNKKAVENAQSKIIAEAFEAKGLKEDGTPIKKVEDKKGGDDIPDYMKTFMEEQKKTIDDLTKQVSGNAEKATQEKLRESVIAKLEEKKIPKSYYNSLAINVTDPEKVSEISDGIVTGFQTLTQDMVNQNLVFDKPQQKQIKVEESDIDNYLDEKFPVEKEK